MAGRVEVRQIDDDEGQRLHYAAKKARVEHLYARVSLHLASNGASAAVNWRLFLPWSWDPASPKADPAKVARRDRCAIPAQVGHVEKRQPALDMIDETQSWGIDGPPGHRRRRLRGHRRLPARPGDTRTRLRGGHLDNNHRTTRGSTAVDPTCLGRGRRPVPACPESAQRVKDMLIAAGKSSARPVQGGSRPGSGRSGVKRMYSRFVALRIRPAGREIRQATTTAELPVRRLLAEWPADRDEPVQFWLSNLPETTPLPVLVRTAKLRRRIENDYREMKQALGLAHFEGRTWPGRHHHVTLVSVAHAFRTLQRLNRSPKETATARAST